MRIALTGQMRSGKDTVADYLVNNYGFTKMAFGNALKDNFHRTFPHIGHGKKPRAYYQRYGQLMRELDADIWVKHVEHRIAGASEHVIISDLRQPNEYEWCRRNQFYIVRVTAPDTLRIERAKAAGDDFTGADLAHDTESHVTSFVADWTIENDSDLAFVGEQVHDMMRTIRRANIDLEKQINRDGVGRILERQKDAR